MDDPITPHLKLIHKYPSCFKTLQIDRGAIRFVLSGAALMVPGLTSAGGKLPAAGSEHEAKAGDVVVIMAEGKEEACMVGQLEVGSEKMKEVKKGVAIKEGHYLGDGLWKMDLS
jgi:PUA domain protein